MNASDAMNSGTDLLLVTDEELRRFAEEFGPTSAEAQVLAQLTSQRAQDLQVFAFRVGDQYVTGPLPEAAGQASAPDPLEYALKNAGKE
jgi:hypothetical protein